MVVPLWLARFGRREWLVLAADPHFLGAGCSGIWRCVTPPLGGQENDVTDSSSYFDGNSVSGDYFTTNIVKQRHGEYSWRRCGFCAIEGTAEYHQNIDHSPKALMKLSKVQPVEQMNHRRSLSDFPQRLFSTQLDSEDGEFGVKNSDIGLDTKGPGDSSAFRQHVDNAAKELSKKLDNIDHSPKALMKLSKVQPVERMNHRRFLSGFPRRLFSTNLDSDDGEFGVKNSDIGLDYTKGPGDSSAFRQHVDNAAKELSRKLDIALLKVEFERDIRPLLTAHCLMLPSSLPSLPPVIHDPSSQTAFFHGPIHGLTKLKVLYLSSLDIMLRIKCLKESEREPLINYIIHRRVVVAEDWSNTYGNIELLEYDFCERNTSFVRGECDASFDELKQLKQMGQVTKKGIAKLAFVIWKGKQLIWAEIFENVPCSDSDFAEVLAVLALLIKCEEEKFSSVEVWSDNSRACGVMTGAQTIKISDGDRDDCLLLRSMRTRFTNLVTVQKPRELMFLTDQLIRMDDYSGCAVNKAIQICLSNLQGSPLFRITNNKRTSDIIKCFDKTRIQMENTKSFRYSPKTTFFLKVRKEHKFDELIKLRRYLLPSCMHLIMGSVEEKSPLLMQQLKDMFPQINTVDRMTTFQDVVTADPKQRILVIVWDASISKAHYHLQDSCTIIFAEDEEFKELEKSGIKEINIETLLYFHRAEYKKMTK